ncbi:MAG: twin-arginine translocase TatA/TatE family subunit [Syntrophales bacterium]
MNCGCVGVFGLGMPEMCVIALLMFEPGEIPELGSGLGKAIKGFKKAVTTEDENTGDATADVRRLDDRERQK